MRKHNSMSVKHMGANRLCELKSIFMTWLKDY